jgi:hypothetical protein
MSYATAASVSVDARQRVLSLSLALFVSQAEFGETAHT